MDPIIILGAGVAVALALVLSVLAKRRTGSPALRTGGAERRPEPNVVEIRDEPDEPTDFGIKSLWIAARAPSAQAVAEALEIDDLHVSNWESGLTAAESYPSDYVFVTPPISGWVLAVGVGLPDPGDPKLLPCWRSLMAAVSQRFGEAWFFGNHRVSSYSVWACYSKGTERRLFAHAEGALIYNYGEPLPEDADLIRRLPNPTATDFDPEIAEHEPDENDVLRLAAAWTIDPSSIGSLDLPPSVGIVGRMRQVS